MASRGSNGWLLHLAVLLAATVQAMNEAYAVTTLAGVTNSAAKADGIGTNALFNNPAGVAIQGGLNRALVADSGNFAIRSVQLSTGFTTTLVGRLGKRGTNDGVGSIARFWSPRAIALHPGGAYALIVDEGCHRIRKMDLTSLAVTTVAGRSGSGFKDGTGGSAKFLNPQDIAIPQKLPYFALITDKENHLIRRLELRAGEQQWSVSTVAGTHGKPGTQDGVGLSAIFNDPQGIAVSPDGQMALITDSFTSCRIRQLNVTTNAVTSLAGKEGTSWGSCRYLDGKGGMARFDKPSGISMMDGAGYALVADMDNHVIRSLRLSDNEVTTVAGQEKEIRAVDAVGRAANFKAPDGLAVDVEAGIALITDQHSIRKMVLPCGRDHWFSPTGTLKCTRCAQGSFTSGGFSSQRTACTICPSGSACDGTSVTQTCTAGRFAPRGSGTCSAACGQDDRYAARGAEGCSTCAPGSFTSGGDATTRSHCGACPAGHECDGTSVQAPCAAGRFAAGTGNANCVDCPLHQYQAETGKSMCNLCSELGGGRTITAEKGSNSKDDCAAAGADRAKCPKGFSAVHSPDNACSPCVAGRFQPAANSADPCIRCDCGKFSRAGAATCDAVCDSGTYGSSVSGACEPCPVNHFCVNSQKRSFDVAEKCIPGERELGAPSRASDRVCEACPAGRFSTKSNAASCMACPSGKFQDAVGQPYCETKQPCFPGSFESDPALNSNTRCRLCPADSFTSYTNAPSCTPCPRGKFQDAVGQPYCETKQPCAPGKYEANVSSVTNARCKDCQNMTFSPAQNLPNCTACPAGKFSLAGQPFCETCSEGSVCLVNEESGLVERKACPAGKTCTGTTIEVCENKISDVETGKCVSCPDLHFANTETNNCVQCPLKIAGSDRLATGVECLGGAIRIQKDYFVIAANGSGEAAVELGPDMTVLKCRGSGVCKTPIVAGSFAVQTECVPPAAGALCGACVETHARTMQSCVKCSGNSAVSALVLVGAVMLFAVLYRQCIKLVGPCQCSALLSLDLRCSLLTPFWRPSLYMYSLCSFSFSCPLQVRDEQRVPRPCIGVHDVVHAEDCDDVPLQHLSALALPAKLVRPDALPLRSERCGGQR